MNQPPVPKPDRINVQFIDAPPRQLQITNEMKNPDQDKPLNPSLFHIAASYDEPSSSPRPRLTSAPLPLDDWTFSRERLENALKARIAGIKKPGMTVQVEPVAKRPMERAVKPVKKARGEGRPAHYHPFETANIMPGLA